MNQHFETQKIHTQIISKPAHWINHPWTTPEARNSPWFSRLKNTFSVLIHVSGELKCISLSYVDDVFTPLATISCTQWSVELYEDAVPVWSRTDVFENYIYDMSDVATDMYIE